MKIDYKDVLKFGQVISDREFRSDTKYTRVRKIKYQDTIYHLQIENDKVTKFVQWNKLLYDESPADIQDLTREDLLDLFMFSMRDRKRNENAERVYWLCVYEINNRYGDEIEILEKEYSN